MRQSNGFTLLEMLIALVLLAAITGIVATAITRFATLNSLAYGAQQSLNNQMVGRGLMAFAESSTANGFLPAPYKPASHTGNTSIPYNPADASAEGIALAAALAATGMPINEINTDGTSAQNVRAYQLVTGLTQNVPLYIQSGPLASLTYQVGAIYQTQCHVTDATCNPTPATGIPGTSPVLTAANLATWTVSGTDGEPSFVSSLPIQKDLLRITAIRADRVRDALTSYLRTQQLTAAAGDTTNWYPAGSPSQAGKTPNASTQFCRDGWYPLTTSSVLTTAGLSPSEFGVTAWGGLIEYCRDYDPAVSAANTPPHYAAIRFNKNVSLAAAPSAVATDNILISF